MGVVDLDHKVNERELQMLRLPPRVPVRGEPVPLAEVCADGCSLADVQVTVLQDRRRKGRRADIVALEKLHERAHAATFVVGEPRDVHVLSNRVFEHEAHELAAPLDSGPVVQPIFSVCHGR